MPCPQAAALHTAGLSPVADSDSLDWKELSAPEITQRVLSGVQPGSIILFHNAALHTPEALPDIIDSLMQEGYTFVTSNFSSTAGISCRRCCSGLLLNEN